MASYEPRLDWHVHIGDRFAVLHRRADVNVVEDNWRPRELFPTLRKPFVEEERRRLVVLSRSDIPCAGTSHAGYDALHNTRRVRSDVILDGQAEVHTMLIRRRRSRVRLVETVASIPALID